MERGRVTQITEAWLSRWCGGALQQLSPLKAFDTVAELKNLAHWWLRREVLEKAAAHARELSWDDQSLLRWQAEPQLPTDPGACWVAVVNRQAVSWELLRPALPLPLRWVKAKEHDPRLPTSLRNLADQVLQELQTCEEVDGPWGLRPNPESLLAGVDLSGLEGSWDSGWAPLTAGLLLAAWEGSPDSQLWASGAWVPSHGIQEVEGLQAKLELAAHFHAHTFFVPENQVSELQQWAQSQGFSIHISPLHGNTTDPPDALGEYLNALQLPIGPGIHLQKKRKEHFLRIREDQTAARFYRKHILPDVVENLREQLSSELSTGGKKLITIVSHGFDLVPLAIQAFHPAQCLLLCDRSDEELASKARELSDWIQRNVPTCPSTLRFFTGQTRDELLAAFQKHLADFTADANPEDLLFDLTAGQRVMNLALYDVAPAGSYVVCVQADFKNRRPIPYTERVHPWRKPCIENTGESVRLEAPGQCT